MSDAPATPCPVCSGELVGQQQVYVCGRCHRTMKASSGEIPLHVTGEFPAMNQLLDAPEDAAPAAPKRPRSPTLPAEVTCSWCGKPGDTVKKILKGQGAQICNECVALCADIMAAELGDDWR